MAITTHTWTTTEVDAPASEVWELLADPSMWPRWGPSVRRATIDGGELRTGATGTVTTAVGVRLPVEITRVEPGRSWRWKVAGIPATDHTVEPLGPRRCRVGFGVPLPAAPYLAVCRVALHRIEQLAVPDRAAPR